MRKKADVRGMDMTLHSLDKSGRVTLKQGHRDELGDEVVFTYGPRTSIRMFATNHFETYKANITSGWGSNLMDPDWDNVTRQLLDCRHNCKIDGQGRLRIPANFIARSGLADKEGAEVEIVHREQMGYFEIWPKGQVGIPEDPDDPFYQARRLLSDRLREQKATSAGEGGRNA